MNLFLVESVAMFAQRYGHPSEVRAISAQRCGHPPDVRTISATMATVVRVLLVLVAAMAAVARPMDLRTSPTIFATTPRRSFLRSIYSSKHVTNLFDNPTKSASATVETSKPFTGVEFSKISSIKRRSPQVKPTKLPPGFAFEISGIGGGQAAKSTNVKKVTSPKSSTSSINRGKTLTQRNPLPNVSSDDVIRPLENMADRYWKERAVGRVVRREGAWGGGLGSLRLNDNEETI